MKQYALFFIKQNERLVVKLYEPEILHCLIELGNNGFNKSVRIMGRKYSTFKTKCITVTGA